MSDNVELIDQAGQPPNGAAVPADDGPKTSAGPPKRWRNQGVDGARGLALIGMMANHTFPYTGDNGAQTVPQMVAGGRASATFALLAGVGIALMSGAQQPVEGRARAGVRTGLAVRGLLIVAIGLALGFLSFDQEVILAYFGLFFIFAIPLLGLRARVLWTAAIAIALLMPVLYHLTADYLPEPSFDSQPSFGTLFHDPVGLLVALCITGAYPALAWMAYICAGLAAGRSQLSSPRVAARLLMCGLALAAASWAISSLLLHPLGGLDQLVASAPEGVSRGDVLDWANRELGPWNLPTWSWWWLAIRSPHSTAPLDLLHTMGAALALLGGMLLLTRIAIFARVLTPLALAGSMTLTLYSAHVVVLSTDLLSEHYAALLLLQLVAGLAFALLWRQRFSRGPLEAVLAAASQWARRAVVERQGLPSRLGSTISRGRFRLGPRPRPAASGESGGSMERGG